MEIKQRFVLGAPAPLATPTGVDIAADNISATNVTTTNLAATNITVSNQTTGTQYVFADQFPGATAGDKINAAIASLINPGGTVDCTGLTGAQTIGSTILMNKSMRLIVGGTTFSGSVNPLVEISASNCIITSTSSKLAFFNQTLPPGNGIKIDAGVAHTLIENIVVQNTGPLPATPGGFNQQNNPVWAAGVSGQTVSDLTIRNCQIGNGTCQVFLEWCNNSHILNNQFVPNAPTSPTGSGNPGVFVCLVIIGSYNVIDGNSFTTTGNVGYLIDVDLPTTNQAVFPGSYYNVISNNVLITLSPIYGTGVILQGSSYCTVAQNILSLQTLPQATQGIALYSNSTVGLPQRCQWNAVVGNTITMSNNNNSFPTINLNDRDGTGVNYNTVIGNTITGAGSGVQLYGASHNVVADNVVTVNATTATPVAIPIFGASTATVVGNIVKGNTISHTYRGIAVVSPASGTVVEGNRVISTSSTGDVGIRLTGSLNTYVAGNHISGTTAWGILVESGATGSLGLNFVVRADVTNGDFYLVDASTTDIPNTAGIMRLASPHTPGVGVSLVNAVTAERTWTFPDATDTFVGQTTTDTLSNKTLNDPLINRLGINGGFNNGTGFQLGILNTASIAPGASLSAVLTWPVPFPDTNYFVFTTITNGFGNLAVWSTSAVTPTTMTVTIHNNDSTPQTGQLWAVGIHL